MGKDLRERGGEENFQIDENLNISFYVTFESWSENLLAVVGEKFIML